MGSLVSIFNANPIPALKIPAGLIVPSTAAAPAGWSDFSLANGRFIVGAGSSYAVTTTGGSKSVSLSGTSTTNGAHTGASANFNHWHKSALDLWGGSNNTGGHSHSVSGSDSNIVDSYKEFRLIKASSDQTEFPSDAMLLANSDLSGVLTQEESATDRFMAAAASYGGTGGSGTASIAVTTNSTGAHNHGTQATSWDGGGVNYPRYGNNHGAHSHAFTMSASLNTKYFYLTAWSKAASSFPLVAGGIAMFESATPPDGWVLCDGTNGTPDLRDYFIRIGTTGQMGGNGGNNVSGSFTGTSNSVSHNHVMENRQDSTPQFRNHSANVSHSHTCSIAGKTIVPPYYALSFIMKAA